MCLSALAMILAVTSRPTAQTVFFYGAESGLNSSLYNINKALRLRGRLDAVEGGRPHGTQQYAGHRLGRDAARR